MQKYVFDVNGFEIEAEYDVGNVEQIFIPLLKKLSDLQREKQRRIFVFLVAPPGCGKTTLSLFLQHLATIKENITEVQAVDMDGFHHRNDYLNKHYLIEENKRILMANRKGSANTFDVIKLEKQLQKSKTGNVMWPIYSRAIHDVIDEQLLVNKDIIILEGNYLLLNDAKWAELFKYCDYSISIIPVQDIILKQRLVDRKIKGGLSRDEAEQFYRKSDYKNIMKVKTSRKADLTLMLDASNYFTIKKQED